MSETYKFMRWHDGKVLEGSGKASTARHLYKGTIWLGCLSGATDESEKEIADALNRRTPPAIPASVVERYRRVKKDHDNGVLLNHIGTISDTMTEMNKIKWVLQQMGCDLRELEG